MNENLSIWVLRRFTSTLSCVKGTPWDDINLGIFLYYAVYPADHDFIYLKMFRFLKTSTFIRILRKPQQTICTPICWLGMLMPSAQRWADSRDGGYLWYNVLFTADTFYMAIYELKIKLSQCF